MNGVNNITIGWIIGGAILALLISLSIFRNPHPKSGDNLPTAVTQSQPQK